MPVSAAIDSTSAALGALLATLALYPLDVAKTRIQAEPGTSRERGTLAMCARIAREDGPLALLVGVTPKAVSTVLSNFAFFYFLAALKRAYSRVGRPPGTAASLAMGSLAGALNMSVTLPTETVTTRLQAASAANQEGLFSSMANIYDEEGILGFWRGYFASLILVINPAIHMTVFDALKARVLRAASALQGRPVRALTAAQAFLLGALSKALATVLTYPLIRVKVLQQAGKRRAEAGAKPGEPEGAGATRDAARPPAQQPAGTAELLAAIWRAEGARGLYKGCDAQLLTTVLKSGLLLMSKEQVLRLTIRLLRGGARGRAGSAAQARGVPRSATTAAATAAGLRAG